MSHTPKQIVLYALEQAINEVDMEDTDWDDVAGHLDVALGQIPNARAYEQEHTVA